MLFRLALAAFMGLSACSDDTSTSDGPLPRPGDINGPGDSGQLRQSADLDGSYAERVRLVAEGLPAGASQELTVAFELDGLQGVRQFEVRVEVEPPEAFDVAGARFAPAQPFVTPFETGIQLEASAMRLGGASLSGSVQGSASLGTLTIRTSSSFGTYDEPRLVVTLLSVGPSSTERDRYEADALRLGIDAN